MTTLSAIDSSTYYPVVIPSTNKKTKFRPFRVRDEKSLLVAQQSEDDGVMLNTLESIIRACVSNCPDDLTVFDVEYLFIQIRSKSVGENAEAVSTCIHCSEKNDVKIDLSTVKVVNLDRDKNIKLSDKLIVKMKYPGISGVASVVNSKLDKEALAIATAIETVYFGDEVFHTKESDIQEIVDFLLNRSDQEMAKLIEFIENLPSTVLESEYKCKKCGEKNKIQIDRLADFF